MASAAWWDYVQTITKHAPSQDIAATIGIEPSSLSRWKKGSRPRADAVVTFARAYGRPPVEALIIAGYLLPLEATQVIELTPPLTEIPTEDLLAELGRRTRSWQVDDSSESPWGRGLDPGGNWPQNPQQS